MTVITSGKAGNVASGKPNTPFPDPPRLRVTSGTREVILRAPVPGERGENCTAATFALTVASSDVVGSVTFTLQRISARAPWSDLTWNKKPGVTGTTSTVTVTSPTAGTVITFATNLPAICQTAIDGAHYGWRLTSSSTSETKFHGFNTDDGPVLDLTVSAAPATATDLVPNGTGSKGKPFLQWTAPDLNGGDDQTAFHVQIATTASPAADATGLWTAPAYDSGTVVDGTPELDLSAFSSARSVTVTIPSATITNKALTSNVATLTTSAAHNFVVGEQVIVSGVDATFDGTYTIASVPTTTTFTYSKTAANVASVASGGTALSTNLTAGAGTFDTTLDVGQAITGTGIPAGATLASVQSATSARLSVAATAAGTITATITRIFQTIAVGSSIYWHVRWKSETGTWAPWSITAGYTREAAPTWTFNNPTAGSVSQVRPTFSATFSTTLKAYRYRLALASKPHRILADSRKQRATSNTPTWDPMEMAQTAGDDLDPLTLQDGASYILTVDGWRTGTNYAASVGDPIAVRGSVTFTVNQATGVTAPTITGVAPHPTLPVNEITLTRPTAPDSLVLYRNGTAVASFTASDVNAGGTTYKLPDTLGKPMRTHAYTVRAQVDGSGLSALSNSVSATLAPKGTWLVSKDRTKSIQLAGPPPTLSRTDTAGVFVTQGKDGENRNVVIRSGRGKVNDSYTGVVASRAGERSEQAQLDDLDAMWESDDPVFLIAGNTSTKVRLLDVSVSPNEDIKTGREWTVVAFRHVQVG